MENLTLKPLKNNSDRARWALISMVVAVVICGISVISLFLAAGKVKVLVPGMATTEEVRYINNLIYIPQLIYIGTLLLAGIAVVLWVRRAYDNLIESGRFKSLDYHPAWTFWAWVVPFISLVRPYYIISEIWNKTQMVAYVRTPEDQKTKVQPLNLIGFWWGFLILHGILGIGMRNSIEKALTIDQLVWACQIEGVNYLLGMVGSLLFMLVIYKISRVEADAVLQHNPLTEGYQNFLEDKPSLQPVLVPGASDASDANDPFA